MTECNLKLRSVLKPLPNLKLRSVPGDIESVEVHPHAVSQ